jgi:serralysin
LLNGTTLSDPFLELLNSSGAVLEFNDDSSGLDAALTYTPSSSGTYYLAARDSGNISTGSYSLSAAPQTAAGDRFEDNDTALTATDLRTISGTVTETGLSVQSNDADW